MSQKKKYQETITHFAATFRLKFCVSSLFWLSQALPSKIVYITKSAPWPIQFLSCNICLSVVAQELEQHRLETSVLRVYPLNCQAKEPFFIENILGFWGY